MSTYYYFKCNKCKRKGGFFSRQAWGWGNFDIIDSFKFLAFHTDNCGEEYIIVISEHSEDYEEDLNIEIINYYKKESFDHFPSSNDWKFMRENIEKDIETLNLLWVEEKTKGIKPDNGIKLHGIITDLEYEEKKGRFFYKAFFKAEDGKDFTFIHTDRKLPEKGRRYFILGESVKDEFLNMVSIGEIRGSIINVRDMRLIDESE